MSASSTTSSQRLLPLTPPSQSEQFTQQPKMSVQLPQTPQSPSQPGKASPIESSQPSTHSNTLPTPAHSINGSIPTQSTSMTSPDSNKRKRESADNGDREQKKSHVEDRELSIDDLHIDVGKKYLLCRSRKIPLSVKVFSIFAAIIPKLLLLPCTCSLWLT